jgi:hypothetical protein
MYLRVAPWPEVLLDGCGQVVFADERAPLCEILVRPHLRLSMIGCDLTGRPLQVHSVDLAHCLSHSITRGLGKVGAGRIIPSRV